MSVKVKVCGITSIQDAIECVKAGVDAIGINFYQKSPRYCDPDMAQSIIRSIGREVVTVGVFVNASYQEICHLREKTGFQLVQLHGEEQPEFLDRLLPDAYKALPVSDRGVINIARSYGGECILLDACVPGTFGGTGKVFNWDIAREMTQERKVVLAGGLNILNVSIAVERVEPFYVDVASGVEKAPGQKDKQLVSQFVKAAKR